MASINGYSGMMGLGATSSIRGFGGLASGLDRDSLIEQLTYGTRTKIEQQKQKQTQLGWQQTAIRSIIDKVYDFTNKFTSYASSSNLMSSAMFSRTDITAVGVNSKYISVTGKSTTADMFSVVGIKQMAEDAKITTGTVSGGVLTTGGIANDLATGEFKENMIANQYLTVKHGGDTYYVKMQTGEGYDYENDLAGALNKAMQQVEIKGGDGTRKLSDVLEVGTTADGKLTFKSHDTAGNNVAITGGTGDVLERLGLVEAGGKLDKDGLVMSGNGDIVEAKDTANVFKTRNLQEYLEGKSLTFSYNGKTESIKLDKADSMADLQKQLQTKLDKAFGKGRVQVGLDAAGADQSKLTFTTKDPSTGNADRSSTFAIVGGDNGLLGKDGVLGIDSETGNRLNLSASLKDAGLADGVDTSKSANLIINGVRIDIGDKGWDTSVEDVIKAINENKEAGVQVTYQRNSDRFVITSTEKGASGSIELAGNIAKELFGRDAINKTVTGKDAIVSVQYAGDTEPTEIIRDSNTFTIDGLTVTAKGTFGYDESGNRIADTEAITFDAKVDTENTTKAVKEMVESFNEILKLINTESRTKPNRGYMPLTASQREGMSETEIKEYEAKAKEGLLFGDTDLRGFADALRFIIPSGDRAALAEIGISVSTDYADNGKLVFNEADFKAALEKDPEKVRELFTRTASTDADGNKTQAGLMENISNVMKRYAGTTGATKGILVERAGSMHSPTSVLKNSLQKQMDEIDKTMNRLLDRLEMEEDRYIAQFTTLESLIAQMNSQSSYFAQFMGGGY